MREKMKPAVLALFITRVCLWIVALVATIYWIYYSIKLHREGIFVPEEYSPRLRPVLYTCLIISVAAVCISFILRAISVRIKNQGVKE